MHSTRLQDQQSGVASSPKLSNKMARKSSASRTLAAFGARVGNQILYSLFSTLMKLKFGPNSPFVRKVLILAIELKLDSRIQRELVTLSPYEPNPDVVELNPLGKIPVLISDDDMAFFDSSVVCEYLSELAGDRTWFPPAGMARWHALRCNSLASGMLEAAQLVLLEQRRPQGLQYDKWIEAQIAKITRALAFLNKNLPADVDMGSIAVACALGWLDYRFPDLGWRNMAPNLNQWFTAFSQRESFLSTRHPGQN
jgi:glutathione S-transferase